MTAPPTPALARAIVRSLTRGTTIAVGVRHVHIGHAGWLAAQRELLGEIAEDGHSDTKFVRGAYGAGKSHFLGVVQDEARVAGWATAHLECRADHVEIDRFETLYPALVGKLNMHDLQAAGADIDPARHLLERWSATVRKEAGIREDGITRPFDADSRIFRRLSTTLHRSSLSADFVNALTAFARAEVEGDTTTTATVIRWLKADSQRLAIPQRYLGKPAGLGAGNAGMVHLSPIGRGNATEAMRGLLWLVRSARFLGLVLCIDEIEELAKLKTRKRQDQSLQALREFVDHAGGQGGFHHMCMYLAATPEMFEGPDYFPRYDALATRIQSVSDRLNWRGPVVDLDRTPLDADEMTAMAQRIAAVHRIGYPSTTDVYLSDSYLDELMSEVVSARVRIAKPRLLARIVVDELERARQEASTFRPAIVSNLVSGTAAAILREATE
ncbi:BREX system ATP-binding domain-containing protein [Mesorhizobium sp. M0006]|uniref:BREX system ATP-binding domain-containing protein n=1 Tax=Mesorhizobium sp. M0006 TaxID=2956838 RepID=UPI0033356603